VSEIDDLYVLLRAQTAPLEEGFLSAGTAGEEMAASIAASVAEINASVDRMAENVRVAGAGIDESLRAQQIEYERLALATEEASWKMEAATTKAAASNEALGASMVARNSSMAAAVPVLTAIGVAVGVVGAVSVGMAADFQSSTQRLVSSAGEIQSNLNMVRQGMLTMAGQVGYSAEELSKGMYTVESAGYHGAEGLKVLRAAAEGAKTENADLATVSNAVTSVLRDYHLGASQAADVTSKLVAGVSVGKTTFEQLTGALHSVLPAASTAHISLSDIIGDLAAMTVHGMSADQAAQNLNDVISHMTNPTAVQAKELALLGMTTNQLAEDLRSKGLAGTLQEISTRILHLMPPGSEKVVLDLKTALEKLPAPVQELGMKLVQGTISMGAYNKAAKDLDPIAAKQAASFATLAGSTHRIGDQMMTGTQAAQTYAAALAKATGDATGYNVAAMLTGENTEYANNAIKKVAASTTEAGNHVKGWAGIQATFNQRWSELKDGLGAVAIKIGSTLLPALTSMMGGLMKTGEWLGSHKTALILIASIIGGALVVALYAAATAAWAFTTALLMNPITWIVVGIGLLIFAIVELAMHWKTVWKAIKDVALDVWHWLVSAWHSIASETSRIWNDIAKAVVDAWNKVVSWVKTAYHFVVDPIQAAWHMVLSVTQTVWNAVLGFLKKWWPLLVVMFAPFIAIIIGIWNRFHTQVIDKVVEAWNYIKALLAAAWAFIKTYIIKPVQEVWDWLVNTWNAIKAVLSAAWNVIASYASAAWNRVYQAIIVPIENAWHRVVAVGDNILNALKSAFDKAWNAVKSVADKFTDVGHDIVMGIVHGVENAAGALMSSLKNLANNALSGAKKALGIGSPSKVFADGVGQWIPAGIAAGVDAAAGVAHSAVAKLASGLAGGEVPGIGASVSLTAAGAGALLAAPLGAGGAAGSGVGIVNEFRVFIGGKEIHNAVVQEAQRTKRRTGSTLLT
jgi:hypothetical protein